MPMRHLESRCQKNHLTLAIVIDQNDTFTSNQQPIVERKSLNLTGC